MTAKKLSHLLAIVTAGLFLTQGAIGLYVKDPPSMLVRSFGYAYIATGIAFLINLPRAIKEHFAKQDDRGT